MTEAPNMCYKFDRRQLCTSVQQKLRVSFSMKCKRRRSTSNAQVLVSRQKVDCQGQTITEKKNIPQNHKAPAPMISQKDTVPKIQKLP